MRRVGGLLALALVVSSAGVAAAATGSPVTPTAVAVASPPLSDIPALADLVADDLGNVAEAVPTDEIGNALPPAEAFAGPATGTLADLGPAPLTRVDINDGWVGIPETQQVLLDTEVTATVKLVRLSDGSHRTWTAAADERYVGQTGDGGVLAEKVDPSSDELVWHKADGTTTVVTPDIGGVATASVEGHRVMTNSGNSVTFTDLDVAGSTKVLDHYSGTGFLSSDGIGYLDSSSNDVYWWTTTDGTGTEHSGYLPEPHPYAVELGHGRLTYMHSGYPRAAVVSIDLSTGTTGTATTYSNTVVAGYGSLAMLPDGSALAIEHPAGDPAGTAIGRFAGGTVTPLQPVTPVPATPEAMAVDGGHLSVIDESGSNGTQELHQYSVSGNVLTPVSTIPISGDVGFRGVQVTGPYTVVTTLNDILTATLRAYDESGALVYEDDDTLGGPSGTAGSIISYVAGPFDSRHLVTVNLATGTKTSAYWSGHGTVLFSPSGTTITAWEPATGRTKTTTAPCRVSEIDQSAGNWLELSCVNGPELLFDVVTGATATPLDSALLGPGYQVTPSTNSTALLYDLDAPTTAPRILTDVAPEVYGATPWLPMATDADSTTLVWLGPDIHYRLSTVVLPNEASLFPPLPVPAPVVTPAPPATGGAVARTTPTKCPSLGRHETVAQARAQLKKLHVKAGDVQAPKGYPKATAHHRWVVTGFLLETTNRVKTHGKWQTVHHFRALHAGATIPTGAVVGFKVALQKV